MNFEKLWDARATNLCEFNPREMFRLIARFAVVIRRRDAAHENVSASWNSPAEIESGRSRGIPRESSPFNFHLANRTFSASLRRRDFLTAVAVSVRTGDSIPSNVFSGISGFSPAEKLFILVQARKALRSMSEE